MSEGLRRSRRRRLDHLVHVADDAYRRDSYGRAIRIASIIERHDLEGIYKQMATDYIRFIQEVKAARGRDVPAVPMSNAELDRLPGQDIDPATAVQDGEFAKLDYIHDRREIRRLIAKGDISSAMQSLAWMTESPLEQARRWAEKRLRELGAPGS